MRLFVVGIALFFSTTAFAKMDDSFFKKIGLEPIHDSVPQFEFKNEKQEIVNATAFSSKPLILHFWASWCESCKKELPQVLTLAGQMPGVEMIFLSADEDAAKLSAFLQQNHVKIPNDVLTSNKENKKFIAWGVPMTYFVSAKRDVFLRAMGAKDWSKLSKAEVEKLSLTLK